MEKLLVGSLELNTTTTGKAVVDLYSTNAALKFPELRLFDLSALAAVGIDPNALVEGERIHRRLWAYYEISDKTNGRGNPYKDVTYLEAIDQPATATSTDNTEVLAALRAMAAQLERIAAALGVTTPDEDPDLPKEGDPIFKRYRYANGLACSANENERAAFDAYITAESARPADVDALRAWAENDRTYQRYRYGNGLPCSATPNERAAFDAYVKAEGKRPADVDALREWVKETPKPRQA